MNLQPELKAGLHEMIDQTEDIGILQAIYLILDRERQHANSMSDFQEAMHPTLKESIERGMEQIKNGQTVSHEEVRKRYEKWLK